MAIYKVKYTSCRLWAELHIFAFSRMLNLNMPLGSRFDSCHENIYGKILILSTISKCVVILFKTYLSFVVDTMWISPNKWQLLTRILIANSDSAFSKPLNEDFVLQILISLCSKKNYIFPRMFANFLVVFEKVLWLLKSAVAFKNPNSVERLGSCGHTVRRCLKETGHANGKKSRGFSGELPSEITRK